MDAPRAANSLQSTVDAGAATAEATQTTATAPRGYSGTGFLRPAATDADRQILDAYWAGLRAPGPANALAAATGIDFSDTNRPDFLAVRTGVAVTAQYSGGNSSVWSVDGNGTEITYFATGAQPNAVKGVAIRYGSGTSAQDQAAAQRSAMTYLTEHLADRELNGAWNRPIFDTLL